MLKRRSLEALCLLFVIAAVLMVTAFGLADDALFFQSDIASVFIVIMAASLPLFALVGAIFALVMLSSRRVRVNPVLYAGSAVAALIAADSLYFLLTGLDSAFRIFGLFRKLDADYLLVVLWALLLAGVCYLLSKAARKQDIAARTAVLSLVVVPLALALFGGLMGYKRSFAGAAGTASGHVVLVVLDGWPAQYMKAFNPEATAKPLDKLLAEALVFTNARTNAAWTNAFFGTLYKGSPKSTYGRIGLSERLRGWLGGGDANLLAALQRVGVKTRVIAYHRNGLPEGSAGAVSGYRGFRSLFLTVGPAPLLDWLGLDYNLVIPGRAARTIWDDRRKAFLHWLLGPATVDYDNILIEALMPQLARIRGQASHSFVLFHTDWKLGHAALPEAWDENLPKSEEREVIEKARQRDYRYDPEDECFAERARRKADLTAEAVGRKIERFVARLKEAGFLDDTLVIFTADHGSMNAKGRLWYGFHADEEVLRVPFVVFGAKRSGAVGRKVESIDIAQTLIEYFGGADRLHPRARSIFGTEEKPFTASVTLRSDVNREWFLALYKEDRKYLFNLHPEGDGEGLEQRVEGFATQTVAEGPDVLLAVLPELAEALADFGFDEETIHAAYHHARLAELERRAGNPPAEP